ncbi:hypothetical protein ACIFOE_22180 [Paenibacillus sp. NRS-1783]|uniref:hypothetical protein n=1 Tax=Paenibacillus sp. NRS-1783 TaxID=3233907 RepID=UPI003D2AFFB5
MNDLMQSWRAWRHLQNLIRFRESGATLEAGNDWLDKEIADLQQDIKKQSSGLGAGRLYA